MYVLPGMSWLMGTSFIPSNNWQSLRSSRTSTPACEYSLSVKHRVGDDCSTTLMSFVFLCIHLHWAGVNATRLSAGVFPSRISPIWIIVRVWYGRILNCAKLGLNGIPNKLIKIMRFYRLGRVLTLQIGSHQTKQER